MRVCVCVCVHTSYCTFYNPPGKEVGVRQKRVSSIDDWKSGAIDQQGKQHSKDDFNIIKPISNGAYG